MSTLQEDRNATKADVYWLVGWTAVLLWDNIVTISDAHRYLMKAKRTPMKVLYILNRYGTVILQTICMLMVVLAVPMNLCRSIFWFQCFASVFVIAVCSIILSIRCWALYERSRRILIVLVFLLAVEIALLIGTISQLRPLLLTPGASIILDFQGCVAVASSTTSRKLSIVFWASTLVFNSIVFVLTMWRSISITRRIGQHLTIWRRLLKAGIVYYSVILGSNIACVAFYSQTKKPLQTFNTPASVVLFSLMSSRLIVALWSENYRSNRLSLDTFTTFRSSPRPGRPISPKSAHSRQTRFERRDSDDYDKVGAYETQIDMSDLQAALPTLSYSGAGQVKQHRRSASIHSKHGSIVDAGVNTDDDREHDHIGRGLPKFEGIVVRDDRFEDVGLDARSTRSEGANKAVVKKDGDKKARDGTASV